MLGLFKNKDVEKSVNDLFIRAAVENSAQLMRFVIRGDMKMEAAAKLAVDNAEALVKEVEDRYARK